MKFQLFIFVFVGIIAASYGAAPANGTTAGAPPVAAATAPAAKPEYPKDLGNGVEMINREDCPGGYCETFLIRPPPPGTQPMGMGMGGMGMGMGMQPPMQGGMGMGMQPPMQGGMGGGNPCCPQLPPSPCGGQQQPSCQLGPPPTGCQGPCPQAPPMPMGGR